MPFLGGRGQASRGYFGGGTTPGAPTVGAATPGDGQISLAFTAPTFNGGLTITTYQYALSTDSYATWTTRSTGTTASPLVITGLTNGTSYSVKIRAVNSLGAGEASDASTATSPFGAPIVVTSTGSDQTITPTAPTTSAPTNTQTFSLLPTPVTLSGSGTWTNPYPSGATTGTGTLNGSAGTTHFVWGTSSGSYPNEVGATSNAYVRTTWPRGTGVYYKAKIINTSCVARFNGTVNSNGSSTTVTFEYGTSSGVYPSSVSAGTVTALTATAVTADVSSLSAGTYYFRTKAVNTAGTTYGTEQSIAISAKSILSASEQSFTPPFVGTIYEALVVAGGGAGSEEGGGGGGVSASDSMSVGSTLTYVVGGGGTNPSGGVYNPGDSSSLESSGVWTMSATGGGGAQVYAGLAGSSGTGSGGSTYMSTSFSGGSTYYGCVDGAGGGGGGAEGAGQSAYIAAPYIGTGGYGGPGKTIYGIACSSGGGGEDIYGDDGYQHGNTPASTYGGGGAYNRTAQAGVVRFKHYGPS